MIGMHVGEHVRAHRAAAHLAQDPPCGMAGAGVDDDVPDEEHVDRVRRAALQLEDVLGQPLHVRDCSQEKPRTASTTANAAHSRITPSEDP